MFTIHTTVLLSICMHAWMLSVLSEMQRYYYYTCSLCSPAPVCKTGVHSWLRLFLTEILYYTSSSYRLSRNLLITHCVYRSCAEVESKHTVTTWKAVTITIINTWLCKAITAVYSRLFKESLTGHSFVPSCIVMINLIGNLQLVTKSMMKSTWSQWLSIYPIQPALRGHVQGWGRFWVIPTAT